MSSDENRVILQRTGGHYILGEKLRDNQEAHNLALLLVRIAERETGEAWDRIRSVMERCHLGEFSSKDGRILRRTEPTVDQVNILNRLKIPAPPAFFDVRLKT
jgi:hypothetical protein